jgi:hypothetical protein
MTKNIDRLKISTGCTHETRAAACTLLPLDRVTVRENERGLSILDDVRRGPPYVVILYV